MGVNGLWQVVQPCARPTNLATLNRKRLAVDASIWIYQFLKAVRDKEGVALRNSHVVGFFRRICKLLWFGIKPVFVFDGGAPALKRQTIAGRKRRREGRREDAVRTAGKLLAVQMHRRAEEEQERAKARAGRAAAAQQEEEEQEEQMPDMSEVVYVDEHGMSKQERMKNRSFRKQDPYHLPELQGSIAEMARPEDPRIMSVEELEEYARQFNDGEDINLYDFSKIDFNGDFFKSLPAADRYNILNAARLRSRLRMGLSKEQLEDMFPDRMAFSRFQIERVRERNMLTQRLMQEAGMTGLDLTINVNARVAGEKDREYILVKNDGAEGGWALGVVSRERDLGQSHKPIDVDAVEFQFQTKSDEEEDEDFEDVPIPGVNRLPPIPPEYKERYAGMDLTEAYAARRQELYGRGLLQEGADDESLFVGEAPPEPQSVGVASQTLHLDEEEDINQAIALSLRSQHGVGLEPSPSPEDDLFGDVEMQPAPVWTQRAADTVPKPIYAKSGRVISSVVNNRATAAMRQQAADTARVAEAATAVDAGNESDSDSDGSIDLQRTLAKASQRCEPDSRPPKSGVAGHTFEGPLPFPKLDWSLFTKKAPETQGKVVEKKRSANPAASAGLDAMAGGFEREPDDKEAPKPLPPWLADQGDIRESLKKQQAHQQEINAEDLEEALYEERVLQRQRGRNMVDLVSSDEESDDVVEVIDNPSTAKQPALARDGVEESSQREGAESPEPTFEDVEMVQDDIPSTNGGVAAAVSPEPTFEDVAPAADIVTPEPIASVPAALPATGDQSKDHDAYLFGDHNSEDDDDFADPEEEELLLRMEEEAAEHARFASTLNNKPAAENLVDYEKELRQLRTQQRKDRRDADEVSHVMVTECQALLRLFGIPYITAPMEAEAQCAELVRLGLADGIVTDDSDIFLFGGTRVYKNMFNGNKFVECYLAADLEREMSLGRDQLVALAQLLGSDYTDGLQGVGPVTAVEILSEFPGADGLNKFREWWDEVQQRHRPKEADAASPFRRKFRRAQATKLFLPPGFPSPAVAEAYTKAEVDSSRENFQWGVPDVEGLRQFLMSTIGWSKERTDDVLLPVVRDMNRREAEGTQANITRFFEGSVGAGALEAFAPRQKVGASKRMAEAVSRLKQKTLTGEDGDQAGGSTAKEKGKGIRKRGRATVVEDGDDEFVEEDGPGEGQDSDEAISAKTGGRGPGRGGARGKRARA